MYNKFNKPQLYLWIHDYNTCISQKSISRQLNYMYFVDGSLKEIDWFELLSII